MDGPRRRSRSAVLSPPPEAVAVEFDSSNPDSSRRPVVTYHVLGQDEGLVGQNSWNRVKRFQPSMSAFFRWETLALWAFVSPVAVGMLPPRVVLKHEVFQNFTPVGSHNSSSSVPGVSPRTVLPNACVLIYATVTVARTAGGSCCCCRRQRSLSVGPSNSPGTGLK